MVRTISGGDHDTDSRLLHEVNTPLSCKYRYATGVSLGKKSDLRSKRILILGASGLLGNRLFLRLKDEYTVKGTCTITSKNTYPELIPLNALDSDQVLEIFRIFKPEVVVNCVGLTSVDECEQRPEAAWLLNTVFPASIAELAKKFESKLIHISTDHFASLVQIPRTEDTSFTPVNQYGLTKLTAEDIILKSFPEAGIIRTNFFGLGKKGGNSILDFAIRSLSAETVTKGVTDICFTPIGVESLVDFIQEYLNDTWLGVMHVAGKEEISKYHFLQMVAKLLKIPECKISALSALQLGLSAPRPTYLSLDVSRVRDILGFQPPTLETMLQHELRKHAKIA